MNKTMNYEIYTGKEQDKIDCPQNMKLFDKKEFVHSVLYPHHALNFSMEENKDTKDKNEKILKQKQTIEKQQINLFSNIHLNKSLEPLNKINANNQEKKPNQGNVTWHNHNIA